MKRLVRIVFIAATLLSLLLFAATMVLWLRSYWRGEYAILGELRPREGHCRWTIYQLYSGGGGVGLVVQSARSRDVRLRGGPAEWTSITVVHPALDAFAQYREGITAEQESHQGHWTWRRGKFLLTSWSHPRVYVTDPSVPATMVKGSLNGFQVEVPYWMGALSFLAAPGARLWRRLRRRRASLRTSGRCLVCGYDLRGGHVKCPECGEATAQPAEARS
jgi:hypothetical protein